MIRFRRFVAQIYKLRSATGLRIKKHDENLKIIKTCIDLSHFSGIDTGFLGRFADSAPTTLMIWEKLILLRENWAAS